MFQIVTPSVTKRAALVALAAAAALQIGPTAPARAADPMMHSSASVGSSTYGTWGDTYTCGTCHKSSFQGGNAKGVAPQVNNRTVNFNTYLSYGDDTGHTTSDHICEVCHTKTLHHRYDNSANGSNHHGTVNCTGCHLHTQGFRKNSNMVSSGGSACDGCHSDLYINTYGWGMHSTTPNISYRHFMDNALTGSDPNLSGQKVGTSFYSTDVPNSTDTNPKARRCLMCHVDHDQFNGKRGYNLRPNAWIAPTGGGTNRDDTLCLSCHVQEKTKAYAGPNLEMTTLPIPYPRITYANATSVLNFSTHGYPVTSIFKDNTDGSTFNSICSKCHNDSIGKNGETAKSYKGGQTGTYKFGAHNSTLPGRFAVFSTDFYQRVLTNTTLIPLPPNAIQISPSPGWVTDQFKGHYLVVTAGAGSNKRALITGNSADTVTVQLYPDGIDNTSAIDITDDNIPVDNTCFSCHSKSGEGKSTDDLLDWYGQKSMSDKLADIFDIFTGDMGTMPANIRNNASATIYLKLNTWNSTNIVGYFLRLPNARQAITALTAGPSASGNAKYPYSYTVTLATKVTSNPGEVEVLKPASHPLDMNARHSSDERSSTGIGWNAGDQGTTTAANNATGATQISDGNKLWSGIEFKDMIITFPNLFANGQIVTSKVTGGVKGVVTFSPAVNGLTTTGGDSYFIGKRHVSCADCHNPHASFKNPEGKVSSSFDLYSMTDATHVNVPGWYNDIWKGFLLKVRNANGQEQIRFITKFDNSTGTFTVSLPWSSPLGVNDDYEVQMGDKWTPAGQIGGRAGSGSSGQWGVIPTAWRVPTLTAGFNNMTTPVSYRQIENVFDNVSSTGLRGSTVAGQRDLCVRCHSSYAYRSAPPATPSGKPDMTITPSNMNVGRGTDISKEFNPNNLAHHAVYARGKNQPIVAGNHGRKTGTAGANSSTTVIYGSGFDTTNYVGKTLVVVAGVDQGQARLISASTTTTLTLASALTTTPVTTGTTATQYVVLDSFNPNWPIYNGLGTGTVAVSSGQATFTGATLPKTTLPGWFLYTYSDNTWREVRTVDSATTFSVTGADVTGTPFILTAGLGNAFVPPFGPWSILRCTDCHGSTKTDPVGPHASVNNWLIKDADTMQFYWFTGGAETNVSLINPGLPTTVVKPKAYFCFNCHRRDVYGDKDLRSPGNYLMSRQPHANYIDTNANTTNETLTGWKVHCRLCHGGDRLGGIHGTNLQTTVTSNGAYTNLQGQRFLNGSAWGTHNLGVKRSTTQAVGSCYTLQNPADATVDACNHGHSGTGWANKATYDY